MDAILSATVAAMIAAGGAAPADAAMPVIPTITKTIINKSKQRDYTNRTIIGGCKVAANGSSCQVSRGLAASRTIDLRYGVSRSFVSTQIGISSGSSVSTTTTCTSPKLKAGQRWVARSMGTRWSYQIRQTTKLAGRVTSTQTSGVLHAFDPSKMISCSLG